MNNQSKQKNVLVTGASKGIGKSIAKVLAECGYSVFICARNRENLEKAAQEIGAKDFFCTDLTTADSVEKLINDINSKYGGIDILVNNAGMYVYSPVEKTEDADIDSLIRLNIETPYKVIRGVVPYMKSKKWGRIVNIGSISGVVGEANASLYSLTKSALTGFSKSLALELALDGITVNTINPGWVDTELAQEAVNDSDFSFQEEIDMIPQRRFISPDEIANLVKYLVSENAKGLTGQSVSLCAGLSAG